MNVKYTIEEMKPDEVDQIASLYSVSFQRKKDATFFTWKYLKNPFGTALCLTTKTNGAIVGSCTLIPEEFCIFGKKEKIYKCCDLMICPDHRKRGLSTKLIAALAKRLEGKGSPCFYTLCSKKATPAFRKNCWVTLGDIYYYFKPRAFIEAQRLTCHLEKLYEDGILRHIGSVPDLCNEYIFAPDPRFIHIAKSQSYLSWRLANPVYCYAIIGCYEAGSLTGYVIYSNGNGNNTFIIDIETKEDNARIFKSLIAAVELESRKSRARSVIIMAVKDTVMERLAKISGYIRNPFKKGPLSSLLDFNILTDMTADMPVSDRARWIIGALNYDDV